MPDRAAPPCSTSIFLTGLGLLTPLGHSPWATLSALLDGRTTADRLAELPEEVEPAALARGTAGISLTAHASIDPAMDLAERAARQALQDAGIAPNSRESAEIALVLASSKGAVLSLIAPRRPEDRAQSILLSPHGAILAHLRKRLGFGDAFAPVAACATSLIALDHASRLLCDRRAHRALVVAVEAALHPLFVSSYDRLGVLAPIRPAQAHRARPLNATRTGFTLNECAAAIMLERCDALSQRSEKERPRHWGRLVACASATDPVDLIRQAEHFTTLERVVRRVVPAGARVALLQPHATGTMENDERELSALRRALGSRARMTPIYASKGAIGHGLGAAGLVNVALSCLFARAGRRPSMPWIDSPIRSDFPICTQEEQLGPGLHVCVAAGFGGHIAGVSIEPTGNVTSHAKR